MELRHLEEHLAQAARFVEPFGIPGEVFAELANGFVRVALEGAYPEKLVARFLSTGPDAYPMPNALGTFMRHPALTGPFRPTSSRQTTATATLAPTIEGA